MRRIGASFAKVTLIVTVFAAAALALEYAGFALSSQLKISYWDPAAALNSVLLLAFGIRYMPAVFFSHWFIGDVIVAPNQYSSLISLVSASILTLCYGTACALLKFWFRIDPRLYCWRDVSLFVLFAGLIAPVFTAGLRITTLAVAHYVTWPDWFFEFLKGFAGEATGTMMLAPALLLLLRSARWRDAKIDLAFNAADFSNSFRWPRRRTLVKKGVAAIGLALITWAAYGGIQTESLDHTYIVFLPLIYIAVQWGYEEVALAVLVINIAAVLTVSSRPEISNAIALQFGLMAVSFSGILLGSVVTESRKRQAQLYQQATYDMLTGLHNRAWFMNHLQQYLTRHQQAADYEFAVFFLDLDRFKTVNNTLGHSVGDKLLNAVSERLRTTLTDDSKIARLGGDEFILLVENCATVAMAETIAQQLCSNLSQKYQIDSYELAVTASVGITMSKFGYESTETLLRDVDLALRQSKTNGRSRYTLFDQAMYEQAIRYEHLENDFQYAVSELQNSRDREHKFRIYYQPIVELKTQKIVGFEALLRWQHRQQSWIPPSEFIPIAENTGLIVPLGNWVLQQACAQMQHWQQMDARLEQAYISVNVSGKQLAQHTTEQTVYEVLQNLEISPLSLKIELTESAITQDFQMIERFSQGLEELGISLSIDDFGTGHSSLSRLCRTSASVIKIDRSFVQEMIGSRAAYEIVRIVIEFAHVLGMSVVAEGIETEAQATQLKALACDEGQGYLFYRPLPPAAIEELLITTAE